MKRKMKVLSLLGVVVIAAVLINQFVLNNKPDDPNRIRVSGNIEVTDAVVSFKIGGRVDQRLCDEGQTVKKGETVAFLDSLDLQAEVAVRQAELLAAQAFLAELEAGSRPLEIEVAKARAASAKAERKRAESDFQRAERLAKTKVIAEEQFVQATGAYEVAVAKEREAQEQLKLVIEGPRQEQIAQGRARVEQAKAGLALAETRMGYATLTAPLTGVVLSKNVEPGEYVAPGTPVVTVGELEDPWLRAYINETDLGRVKLGQRVQVTTDSYPDKKYEGRISFIASQAEFTPKNVQTEKERVKLVYRIKVDLTNPNLELKPGMPADAEILLTSAEASHAGNTN